MAFYFDHAFGNSLVCHVLTLCLSYVGFIPSSVLQTLWHPDSKGERLTDKLMSLSCLFDDFLNKSKKRRYISRYFPLAEKNQ